MRCCYWQIETILSPRFRTVNSFSINYAVEQFIIPFVWELSRDTHPVQVIVAHIFVNVRFDFACIRPPSLEQQPFIVHAGSFHWQKIENLVFPGYINCVENRWIFWSFAVRYCKCMNRTHHTGFVRYIYSTLYQIFEWTCQWQSNEDLTLFKSHKKKLSLTSQFIAYIFLSTNIAAFRSFLLPHFSMFLRIGYSRFSQLIPFLSLCNLHLQEDRRKLFKTFANAIIFHFHNVAVPWNTIRNTAKQSKATSPLTRSLGIWTKKSMFS